MWATKMIQLDHADALEHRQADAHDPHLLHPVSIADLTCLAECTHSSSGCLVLHVIVSWKVILTFEMFLVGDIRENKVSVLPERRAKILRGQGLGPRYAHISTDTRRNDKVTFHGKAETCL